MGFFKKLHEFVKEIAGEPLIPSRDKRVILVLLLLIISPLDLIPDWIPVYGLLDDLIMLALVLDYFFNVLDDQILLSHYPFGMKSFATIRRSARAIAILAPRFLANWLWTYEASPYRR